MTEAIKKMLEPSRSLRTQEGVLVHKEDFETLKRGFLKLMEQRNAYIFRPSVLKEFGEAQIMDLIAAKDSELEAAMKGGE